jgi:hypothetical protein
MGRILRLLIFIGAASALIGCMGSTAKTRFAREYSCPESQVSVTRLGGGAYRMTGCGQTATYTCISPEGSPTVTCVHD